MKFNSKNFVKNYTDNRVRSFVESREGLIWDILDDNTCRVRIQGTNTYVIAKFPQNVKVVPAWLKKGNSVRIAHRGGIRGFVYVIGQGTTVPTPMSGEPFPDPDPLVDVVLTGCEVTEVDPLILGVLIASGTFRINEVVYNLSVSDNWMYYDETPTLYYDGVPIIYYDGSVIKYLDAAPASGLFRYDAFCVGEDSVIDYLKGSESTNPVKPTIPDNHLLLDDYILIIGGITEIENKHIGMQFTIPAPTAIDIDIEGEGISYELLYDGVGPPQYTYADIVVTVLDQYLNPLSGTYTLQIDKVGGDGDFWSDDTGYHNTSVTQGISSSFYTFKYRREQALDSVAVVFSAYVMIGTDKYESVGIITLEEVP